ncbi:MAG: patatin-like phospholipase family protein [Anaerolineae bacterium]|nr:patatin-like phospholipase family protein [Anaerolineae bacterium]
MAAGRKRVGLALSGGGARGAGHVGVLEVLDREKVPIDCIAGTSAGSLVGAAYAAGIRGERLVELTRQTRWRHMARFTWPHDGLVSFAPLERYLTRTMGDLTFADLEIPFAAVATDMATGEQVTLRQGRVAPAVRASCSVPGVVAPLELNGRLLADGGVVNNLPISVVRDMGAEVVIAVSLFKARGRRPRGFPNILATAVEYMLVRAGDDPSSADVCISLPMAGLSSILKPSGAKGSMALGRQMAEEAMPRIKALLEQR